MILIKLTLMLLLPDTLQYSQHVQLEDYLEQNSVLDVYVHIPSQPSSSFTTTIYNTTTILLLIV